MYESQVASLIKQFPALCQIIISQHGKVLVQYTNPAARENSASIVVRTLTRAWARAFSSPLETFQHRIAGRSNIRSATKSIVALLVGIALRDGVISSLDQTLEDLLPRGLTQSLKPAKRRISLHHLLTMTSGLESMESGVNAFKLFASHDWTRFMLSLKQVSEPGDRFLYNSANPHIVSAILSYRTGKCLLDYANENLFEPLGVKDVPWGGGPEGTTFGGGNLFLSAEDLLQIGELCLQHGTWNGNQIIPAEWFDKMWQPYQQFFPGWNYGYYWYVHEEQHPQTGERFETFSAAGSGGQKLLLIPKLELILVAVTVTDFVGERGIVLNQFISNKLMNILEVTDVHKSILAR
jgi:CubicO group peptidase (beta-lactamase class C family)